MSTEVIQRYESERIQASAVRDTTGRQSRTIANARFATFVIAAITLVGSIALAGGLPWLVIVVLAVCTVAFITLVNRHERVEGAYRRAEARVALCDEAINRYHRRWTELPDPPASDVPDDHPYARDLDVTGHASLEQLLGTVETGPGRETLLSWLSTPATVDEIVDRQQAGSELREKREIREQLMLEARIHRPKTSPQTERFLTWAEASPRYKDRIWLRVACWIGPLALITAIVARVAGWTVLPLWVVPFTLNVAITTWLREAVGSNYHRAFSAAKAIDQYRVLFRLLAHESFDAPLLRRVQERLTSGGEAAHDAMARLRKLSGLADLRYSMFHFPVQLLTLWDAHLLFALERWQARSGPCARAWLEAVGDAEATAAFGTLADDHPDWIYPRVTEDAEVDFTATALGHPLLSNTARVCNDVSIGPTGTFVLVTGSNMSGKSTLLRAIGCNVVLAQAGGPVCARSLQMRPAALYTSMRIQDSLEAGLSYFMAGLTRLKQVVDAAGDAEARGGRKLLYLLDELLQGTNTAERRIAVRSIIMHLLSEDAIGAITTHDLALAEIPELQGPSQPVFFTETVDEAGMRFDYKLREGVATSRNALRLMEMIGIEGGRQ